LILAGIIRELHGIPGGLRCEKGDPGERGEKGERGEPGQSFSDPHAVRLHSASHLSIPNWVQLIRAHLEGS